jgi:hypothetical protein
MKISGQFESETATDNHAIIGMYIETCLRNGLNEISAYESITTDFARYAFCSTKSKKGGWKEWK